jgi:hypothetical protein
MIELLNTNASTIASAFVQVRERAGSPAMGPRTRPRSR